MTNREQVNLRAGRKHELAREHLGLDWYDTESQARRLIESIAEQEAGCKLAEAQVVKLREQVADLEKLRPHWAQGYSSDGVAAQVTTSAITELWEALGVDDQTAAVQAIHDLKSRVYDLEHAIFHALDDSDESWTSDGYEITKLDFDQLRALVPESWEHGEGDSDV